MSKLIDEAKNAALDELKKERAAELKNAIKDKLRAIEKAKKVVRSLEHDLDLYMKELEDGANFS